MNEIVEIKETNKTINKTLNNKTMNNKTMNNKTNNKTINKTNNKKTIKKTDDCIELKNIKYQTMLINNNIKIRDISTAQIGDINIFLNQEKEHNKTQPWSKLGAGVKIKKIYDFIETYITTNDYTKTQKKTLQTYLKKCMDRKKLQRARDVIYDINNGKITNIPGLMYNNNKFTLKNLDKKGSTLKNLAPKKHRKKKSKTTHF